MSVERELLEALDAVLKALTAPPGHFTEARLKEARSRVATAKQFFSRQAEPPLLSEQEQESAESNPCPSVSGVAPSDPLMYREEALRSYARWLGFDPDWTVLCPPSTQEERYDDLVRHARKAGLDPEQVLVSRESFEKGEKEAAESAARQEAALGRALTREMPTGKTPMQYLDERLDALRRAGQARDAHLARLEQRVQKLEGSES